MSSLEQFSDMTGTMSDAEVNAENISNIIDEFNRLNDQVDSLNSSLSVIAYGSLTYDWDGNVPETPTVTAPISSAANFMGLVYMSRSSESDSFYHALPFTEIFQNGNGDSVNAKVFVSGVNPAIGELEIDLNFFNTGSPEVFTFYYIIVLQPANIANT